MQVAAEPWKALSVALVESEAACDEVLEGRVRLMGCQPAVFASVADLLAALSSGERFDLLLLAVQDEMTSRCLSAVCKVLALPVLFVVKEGQWGRVRDDGFAWSDAVGFDVSEAADEEMAWRLRALLQRASARMQSFQAGDMVWGEYEFLGDGRTVLHRDERIVLQPRQFALALELFRNIGSVLTRDLLRDSLWKGSPSGARARALDVCVASLRRKLRLCEENGFVLRAVYRRGYQLVPSHSRPASAIPGSPALGNLAIAMGRDGISIDAR